MSARVAPGAVGAVAWTETTMRAADLAGVLGGRHAIFGGGGLRGRRTAPLRYLLNTVRTIAWYARHRPAVLIVQNPPIVLALLGWALTRLTGSALILDSHPGSFGLKGRKIWAAVLPIHRWLARRSIAVLVTVSELADEVERWGGRALIVHEAPPDEIAPASPPAPRADDRDLEVLLVAVFASDEPVDAAIEAARLAPGVTVRITGDPARAPELVASAPGNVEFVGYLDPAEYAAAVASADVVLALTTEGTSVMRAGYEAVYAERPLIVSDWPVASEVFPHALRTPNTPDGIAAALDRAQRELRDLRAVAGTAREEQHERWRAQREGLARCCSVALQAR